MRLRKKEDELLEEMSRENDFSCFNLLLAFGAYRWV
jgi:hypothetical protein